MPSSTPLIGEPLALDLVNTRTASKDLLATLDDLREWLTLEAPRLPDEVLAGVDELTTADLAAVRRVRQDTSIALAHLRRGQPPPTESTGCLNDAQRRAPSILELAPQGASVAAIRSRTGPLGARLAASLAEAAVLLLTRPDLEKIRRCDGEGCVMLFVATRSSRRWCASNRCGNRARVALHHRRKAGRV